MTVVKLQIQYCGGCNPEIDRGSVTAKLKQIMESAGAKLVICKDEEPEWLILVNGCAKACLEEQFTDTTRSLKRISVQGKNLNYRPLDENELPHRIWQEIIKS